MFARDVASAWCRDVVGIRDDPLEELATPMAVQMLSGPTTRTMKTWLRANLRGIGEFSRADVGVLAEAWSRTGPRNCQPFDRETRPLMPRSVMLMSGSPAAR